MYTDLVLYLGGGLFNAGERIHNLYLEKHLRALGYKTILPQRDALKFFSNNRFDLSKIVGHCADCCEDTNNLFVGNLDGSDADSGMAVEFGIAISKTDSALLYRTDFRTNLETEQGRNAMFTLPGTMFVYEPCFVTEIDQIDAYYALLARKIHEFIIEWVESA